MVRSHRTIPRNIHPQRWDRHRFRSRAGGDRRRKGKTSVEMQQGTNGGWLSVRRRTGYCVGPLAFLIFRFASCHLTAQLVAVDPAYPAGDGPDYFVRAVALQPDGGVLIGGLFTNVNRLTRPYFARLNVDGTLDESFSPQLN